MVTHLGPNLVVSVIPRYSGKELCVDEVRKYPTLLATKMKACTVAGRGEERPIRDPNG